MQTAYFRVSLSHYVGLFYTILKALHTLKINRSLVEGNYML